MTEYSTHERIEAYLAKTLSAEDLRAFEESLAADERLQHEVQRHIKARKVLDYAYYQDLKERLRKIDADADAEMSKTARFRPLLRNMAIAATLIIGVGIVASLWIRHSFSQDAVARKYLATAEVEVFRGANDAGAVTINDRLVEAQRLFEKRDYQTASDLYAAVARESGFYTSIAEWNLTLCYLAMGDRKKFNDSLQGILDSPGHPYHDHAVSLRKKVQSPLYQLAN